MAGIILGFYYHQVAIKVIFKSDPTVEGARGASRNVPLAAEVPPQKVNRVCVAWTDRPRVAVTARKIKTFRMGCARVKWIAGNSKHECVKSDRIGRRNCSSVRLQ